MTTKIGGRPATAGWTQQPGSCSHPQRRGEKQRSGFESHPQRRGQDRKWSFGSHPQRRGRKDKGELKRTRNGGSAKDETSRSKKILQWKQVETQFKMKNMKILRNQLSESAQIPCRHFEIHKLNSKGWKQEKDWTNPKQRRVQNFLEIWENCYSCNNWRLPGEPQISGLLPFWAWNCMN